MPSLVPVSRHWAAHVLKALALACVFVAAAVGAVALHGDLPLSRRLVAHVAQDALGKALGGTVTFAPLTRVSFTHVEVPKATLFDRYGKPVIELSGVRVDLSLRTLAHDLILGASTDEIVVSHIQVTNAMVTLIPDPKTGEPTLVRAVSPPVATTPSSPGAGGPEVVLPSIELADTTVSVHLAGLPSFEARLKSVHGQIRAGPKGVAIDVNRFGIALHGANVPAHGTGTFALRAPGPLQSTFDGFIGDVEVRAAATLDGTHLDVSADVPQARPAAMRALYPDWPLAEAITVHADMRGDLPELTAHLRASAGLASLAAEGPLTLGDKARALLVLSGEHLDAHALAANAVVTDLNFDGAVDAHAEGEHYTADVSLRTLASTAGDHAVPSIDARATIRDGTTTGTLDVHDPTVPVTASFTVTPSLAVDVNAETAEISLAALERFGVSGVRGRGRARVRGHVEGGLVHGTVDVDARAISTAGGSFGKARVHADVSGPLADPAALRGMAHVEASSAQVSGLDLDRIAVDAQGSAARLDFKAELGRKSGPSATAKGTANLVPRPTFERTRVTLDQGPVHMEGDVESLDLEQGRAEIDNVRVTGAGGTISGALRIAPNLLEVSADGEGVDMEALARALGLPRGTAAGTLRIATNLAIGRDVTRGHVSLGLGNATLGTVGGLSMQFSADLDDRHVTGEASGLVAGIGTFGTTFDTTLDGPALEAKSWQRATGTAEVQVGDVHLALLGALLPSDAPISGVSGHASGRVLLERKSADAPLPNAFLTVSTQALTVTAKGAGAGAPLSIAGIDLTATGNFNGTTGDSTGTTLAVDAHGDLFTATGAIRVDVKRLLREPMRALSQLVDTPIDMVVTVPAHRLADFPPPLRQETLVGTVSALASVRGTLAHPTLFVGIEGHGLGTGGSESSRPFDAHADGQFEWNTSAVSLRATAAVAGREVGALTLRGTMQGGVDAFRGTARLDLNRLPLDAVGLAGEHGIQGSLIGTVALSRNDTGGAMVADVRVVDALIEHTALGEGHLTVTTSGNVADAKLSFDGPRGTLDANGTVPLAWAGGPFPHVGSTSPVRARAVAHDFAAISLTPVVAAVLSRVSGRLDADLSLELTPVEQASGVVWSGGVEGTAALRDGSVFIDALGLEVNDLSASATAHGKGATTAISIRDVLGRVRSSKPNLRATADLTLEGVLVTHGTAELDADDMPILFRGVPQGRITGRADARLTRESDRMQVDLTVQKLLTMLPQASARQVQDLADHPDISVLQYQGEKKKEPGGTPWRLSFQIGPNVNLRRADVDLSLTGSPVLDFGEKVVASGTVELSPGGRIPVLGKVFSVEQGRVIFDTDDPGNPHVALLAATRAANDSTIYVEVSGTMQDAKIALRSDPPLPEAEVFALLVGGSSPEATADPTQTNASGQGAMALGSGVALGVNQLTANSPVEVRVDTTQQNLPRYTAAVRIRENLWFEASEYQQADYGLSASSNRNVVSGTVDYRFTRRWSLRTEVGTAGGALDLLWQYRY